MIMCVGSNPTLEFYFIQGFCKKPYPQVGSGIFYKSPEPRVLFPTLESGHVYFLPPPHFRAKSRSWNGRFVNIYFSEGLLKRGWGIHKLNSQNNSHRYHQWPPVDSGIKLCWGVFAVFDQISLKLAHPKIILFPFTKFSHFLDPSKRSQIML